LWHRTENAIIVATNNTDYTPHQHGSWSKNMGLQISPPSITTLPSSAFPFNPTLFWGPKPLPATGQKTFQFIRFC